MLMRLCSALPGLRRGDKPPRLALRFAVYTGIALLVVAIAMLWILEQDVETRAEQRAVAQTQQIAEAALRRHLQGSTSPARSRGSAVRHSTRSSRTSSSAASSAPRCSTRTAR